MAKYYHQYKEALAEHGYTVDNDGYVWDANGNQAAGEDIHGNVQSKDPNVTEICRQAEAKPVKAKKKTKKAKAEEMEEVKVRARDEKGHFIADDPDTPENEAWTTKLVKKIKGKK